jgi:hypothetical protein
MISGANKRSAVGFGVDIRPTAIPAISFIVFRPKNESVPNPASCQKLLAPDDLTKELIPNGAMMLPAAMASAFHPWLQIGASGASAL